MPLITRQGKGSKLTIEEMDGNLLYLQTLGTSHTSGTSGSSGTSGANGTSGSSGTSGANGVSGGGVYYLNYSVTQSPYKELSRIPTSASESSIGATVSGGATATVASFMTASNDPNATVIPAGIWGFYLHCTNTGSSSFDLHVEVYKRNLSNVETLLFSTDPVAVTTLDYDGNVSTPTMFITDGYQPGFGLLSTDRIVAKVIVKNNNSSSRNFTLYTEGNDHYSYGITTLGVVNGSSGTSGTSGANIYQPYIGVTGGYLTFYNGTSAVAATSLSNQFGITKGQNWGIRNVPYGATATATSSDFHLVFSGGTAANSTVDLSDSSIPVGTPIVISDSERKATAYPISINVGAGNSIISRFSALGTPQVYASTWALTSNATSSTVGAGAANITASNLTAGSNLTIGTFSSNGVNLSVGGSGWSLGSPNANTYVDFTFTCATNFFASVQGISASMAVTGGSSSNLMSASFQYSLDGTNFYEFGSLALPASSDNFTTPSFSSSVIQDSSTIKIRIYPYATAVPNSSRSVYLINVVISGTDYAGSSVAFSIPANGMSATLQKISSTSWQVLNTN